MKKTKFAQPKPPIQDWRLKWNRNIGGYKRLLTLLLWISASRGLGAFEVINGTGASVQRSGIDATVTFVDGTYSLTNLPEELGGFEVYTDMFPAKYSDQVKNVTVGDDVTLNEALKVIEADYREKAFDFDSIKIRNPKLLPRRFVIWCSNYLFTCHQYQFRVGSFISFEVNGRNLNGGMTGFTMRVSMISRLPGTAPLVNQSLDQNVIDSKSLVLPERPPLRLGINFSKTTIEFANLAKMDTPAGVIVVSVVPKSVADAAGIIQGDAVLTYGGKAVTSPKELQDLVKATERGTTVVITIWRAGAGKKEVEAKFF